MSIFGKKTIEWKIKNGEVIHKSDGTGAVNINLVYDGIEFPNEVAVQIYKDGKIAERETEALLKQMKQENSISQARIKRDGFGGGKNNDVDGTDVSGWGGC